MTNTDKQLISQMIKAGHFNAVYDLLCQKVDLDAKEIIAKMGNKYCCHPDNSPVKGNYGI